MSRRDTDGRPVRGRTAARPAAGGLIWSHDYHPQTVMSLHADGGVVCSGGSEGSVIAADAEDGTKLWEHTRHGSGNTIYGVVVHDGVVYSCGYDDVVRAADVSDGSQVWSHGHHGNNVTDVTEDGGYIYSCGWDNRVIKADATDGSFNWSHTRHGDWVSAVGAGGGYVYSGGYDNNVINVDTGNNLIWTRNLPYRPDGGISTDSNLVYVCGDYNVKVIALDASDGTTAWEHSHHSYGVEDLEVDSGVLYTAGQDNKVMAADTSDGGKIWEHGHHTDAVQDVSRSDGAVFSGSWDGTVKAAYA